MLLCDHTAFLSGRRNESKDRKGISDSIEKLARALRNTHHRLSMQEYELALSLMIYKLVLSLCYESGLSRYFQRAVVF